MTQRELDARVASIQYTETTDLNLPAIEVAGDAFEAGVEWADEHPHWISVEDERIRKKLISFVENWKNFRPNSPFDDYAIYTSDIDECDRILAWLEEQGEGNHPHWISVKDELPPYGQQVLAYCERDPWAEMWWSNRYTEDGARFGEDGKYQVMTDNNGFVTLRDDDNEPIQVTHWMSIEPPAVLSSLERAGKKWKEKKVDKQ